VVPLRNDWLRSGHAGGKVEERRSVLRSAQRRRRRPVSGTMLAIPGLLVGTVVGSRSFAAMLGSMRSEAWPASCLVADQCRHQRGRREVYGEA